MVPPSGMVYGHHGASLFWLGREEKCESRSDIAYTGSWESLMSFLRLSELSRLIVTGKDRAKYLHNFCTNNIKELPSGRACEAFFCDVKARVIAHGYVLGFDDCLEIWMLGGDEASLLKHLNRYIITEDVTITSETESTTAIAVLGLTSAKAWLHGMQNQDFAFQEPMSCARPHVRDLNGVVVAPTALSVTWADTPMLWMATPKDSGQMPLPAGAGAAAAEFEELRIRERFPIVNQDLSIDNMAPEAERNTSAISYVKGCYLGQEPIARLDAMGHVNRALRCVEAATSAENLLHGSILSSDGTVTGVVTSAATVADGSIGLALIRASANKGPLHCVIDGANVAVKV
jgi:folate-binding protein YgfZ